MVKEVSLAILTVSLYNQSILSWKFVPQVVIEEMLSDYPRHYKLAWQARHSISRNGPSSSQCNKKFHNLLFLHETSNGMERVIQKFQKKKLDQEFREKSFLAIWWEYDKKVEWNSSMSDWIRVVRDLDDKNCGKNIVSSSLVIFAFFLDAIMTVNPCFCVISAGCYEAFYGRI